MSELHASWEGRRLCWRCGEWSKPWRKTERGFECAGCSDELADARFQARWLALTGKCWMGEPLPTSAAGKEQTS